MPSIRIFTCFVSGVHELAHQLGIQQPHEHFQIGASAKANAEFQHIALHEVTASRWESYPLVFWKRRAILPNTSASEFMQKEAKHPERCSAAVL